MPGSQPTVVGIGGSTHDYAYYCIDGYGQHHVIEEERISRSKHAASGFSAKSREVLVSLLPSGRPDLIVANDAIVGLDQKLIDLTDNFEEVGHHFSHACWAFFSSGLPQAAILVVDGCGSVLDKGTSTHTREVSTIWAGDGSNITLLEAHAGTRSEPYQQNTLSLLTSDSIGDFYTAISVALGFGDFGAGKVMALAGLGTPKHVDSLTKIIVPTSHGQLKVDLSDFGSFTSLLFDICGTQLGDMQSMADLAASAQQLFEQSMSSLCHRAYDLFPSESLCLSGGCALNVAFNGKIKNCTPFKNTHIVNAPGDSGTAGGAALWGRRVIGNHVTDKFETVSLGSPREEGLHALAENRLELAASINEALDKTAELLMRGEVIAWHVGRSEYGPRALGNRSIIASPKVKGVKEKINNGIKKRLPFQPFGMAVLSSATEKTFGSMTTSPYMETALPVLPEVRDDLLEVTHCDGTIRFQTVSSTNPFFPLLRTLERKGQLPAILNTSLNGKNEPICETLEQTITFMENGKIRFLYLEDRLYTWRSRQQST